MSALISTELGDVVPPAPRHSVAVHFGREWETFQKFSENPHAMLPLFKSIYPRMKPHKDIEQLAKAALVLIGASQDEACLIFCSLQSARECLDFATSEKRNDGINKRPIPANRITIRAFVAKDVFFCVFFPDEFTLVALGFWSSTGVGVSSRFAEANLNHLNSLKEITMHLKDENPRPHFDGPLHQRLKERIISCLERAPVKPANAAPRPQPSFQDVYFFPSGMASIYKPYSYMRTQHQAMTVLYGMSFLNTIILFQEYGGLELVGFGADERQDLEALERFLAEERRQGRKVQAIWTEFPANPLLTTPDIDRIRELADEYDVIFGIDDTIGGFANVDIMSKADLLVTSLTKSFNGYADVIAGSTVLNPASRKYAELKSLFDKNYVPELYMDDAETILLNSRDYLERTVKHNRNARALAQYLFTCAENPNNVVKRVYYPTVSPTGENYRRFMRPATPDFVPGFGCLLSMEFVHVEAARVFHNNLNVYKGPHLGAPFTLVWPYATAFSQSKRDWALQYGIESTLIRIAVGLEEPDILLEDFRIAIEAANKAHLPGH